MGCIARCYRDWAKGMNGIHYKKRFLKGLLIALRIIVSYKLFNLLSVFMTRDKKEQGLKALHRRNAVLIREKAIEMKGVMIKVGQFLSSRIDFLPDEYTSELSLLQDSIPPHDYNEIRKRIIDELGAPPEDIFLEFNIEPIAAASLGQVHEAVLKDARRVAVKIQYPDIERIIETDIRMFKVVIRLFRGRYGRIDFDMLHGEFSRIIRGELDYLEEGKNAERFGQNFKGDERVIFPAVYWEYTTRHVLTLEFVEGIKITEYEAIKAEGINSADVATLLSEVYSRMIYLHGFFHGDPHPGNIFVQDGPKLVFVDFGMVQAIPERIKRELRRFANAIVERNPEDVVDSMRRMGFILEGADYRAIIDVAQSLMDKYRDISPVELKRLTIDDIEKEIENVIMVLDFIQIPNNFILLGRTIGILNGISFRLNPEVNIIEIGNPFIKEFLKGGRREQVDLMLRELKGTGMRLWRIPSLMDEFLNKANKGDMMVRLSPSDMEKITDQFTSLSKMMMMVILTVTAAAAALFFEMVNERVLSVVAAASSVTLGILSAFRLMRK
ncbi:MAG: AarF/ABC1/UbiB kinase family protein [Nitrospirae bacterium]|nr:AarF/ABC1/UbiB kinase family protein [Nitrospirota bacterium]